MKYWSHDTKIYVRQHPVQQGIKIMYREQNVSLQCSVCELGYNCREENSSDAFGEEMTAIWQQDGARDADALIYE